MTPLAPPPHRLGPFRGPLATALLGVVAFGAFLLPEARGASLSLPPMADTLAPHLIHGEVLRYTGDFGVFGQVGTGILRTSHPECRDREALVRLDFSFQGRVMLMRIRDATTSWLEAGTLRTVEYRKEESHPMGSHTERVRMHLEQGWWEPEGGVVQALETPNPLDELSFLFLARAIELGQGESVEVNRHFDPARSPVRFRDRGVERVRVPAGTFEARVVEMEVHDPGRFGGQGRIVLHLTNDARRVPVRIATAMPVVGSLVLVLEERSVEGAPDRAAGGGPASSC